MKRLSFIYLLPLLWLCATLTPVHAQTAEYKLMHMGNQQFHKRNYDKAATYYRKALEKNNRNTRAMFNIADCYLAKGDVQAADSLYAQVAQAERNPQIRSMAWHNRGYICQASALQNREKEQELLRAAIEHYKQALRLNPRDNDTRYNLALCQKQLKNSPQQNQQDKQKQQEQKKQEQEKQKNKEQDQNKNNQQQQQQNNKDKEQEQKQTEQYLNLAKQAEKRALQRLKQQQPRQKSLDKNW